MSNDLISRKELIEKLEEWCGDQRYLIPEDVRKIIQNLPTVFDKEKVIGQFKNASYWLSLQTPDDDGYIDDYCDSEVIDLDVAIEIVEKGGIK